MSQWPGGGQVGGTYDLGTKRPKIGCHRHHQDDIAIFFQDYGDSKVNRLIWHWNPGWQWNPGWHWNPGWWVDSNWSKSEILWISRFSPWTCPFFFSFTFGGFWIFGREFFLVGSTSVYILQIEYERNVLENLRRLVFSKAWFIQPLVGFGIWSDHKSILTGHRSNYWGLFVSNLFAGFTSKYYTLENSPGSQ